MVIINRNPSNHEIVTTRQRSLHFSLCSSFPQRGHHRQYSPRESPAEPGKLDGSGDCGGCFPCVWMSRGFFSLPEQMQASNAERLRLFRTCARAFDGMAKLRQRTKWGSGSASPVDIYVGLRWFEYVTFIVPQSGMVTWKTASRSHQDIYLTQQTAKN